MRVNVETINDTERKVEVYIPVEDVEQKRTSVFNEIRKHAKIKGFRPGKAPESVVEGMYREQIKEEVSSQLISESFDKALEEVSVSPVSRPMINPDKFEREKEFHYTATFEVIPEFEVHGYEGLKLKKEKVDVKEEDINKALERLRERSAEVKPLEELREVREGDNVVVDYEGVIEGEVIDELKKSDVQFPVGEGKLIPEFEQNIIGMKKGEEKDFEVTYDEDFRVEEAAGKTVKFHLVLNEILEKTLPELDDEFAIDLGEENLESLRNNIRKEIEENLKQQSQTKLKQDVIDALLDKHSVSVPSNMVEEETTRLRRNYAFNYQRYGIEVPELDEEQEEQLMKSAKSNVKASLILGAISKKESIEVSSDEIDARLLEISESANIPLQRVREIYSENNMILSLEVGLIEDKVIDFIVEKAQIEEVSEEEKQIDTES